MDFYNRVWKIKLDKKLSQRSKLEEIEALYSESAALALERGDLDTHLLHGGKADLIAGILGTSNWLGIAT